MHPLALLNYILIVLIALGLVVVLMRSRRRTSSGHDSE